jgi:GT2 family glycosyltransferase
VAEKMKQQSEGSKSVELSIIIVNWNSKEYVERCIGALLDHSSTVTFEIIVIDSGSFDGCEKVLARFGGDVRFLQSAENLGFARANNRAVEDSKGASLLFLNPDTEVRPGAVDLLYKSLNSLCRPGVVGCRLVNTDGSIQTSCIKAFPTIANEVADVDALRRIFPRARLWGMRPLFDESTAPNQVDVVSGACMMMWRQVFDGIGGFDSRYFVYSEDVEICLKAATAGFRNYYVPTAVVVHHGGRSTAGTENTQFSDVMAVESRWRYFAATRSTLYAGVYRFLMGVVSVGRIVLILLMLFISRSRKSTAGCQASLSRWMARLRWTVGLEPWVKQYRYNG